MSTNIKINRRNLVQSALAGGALAAAYPFGVTFAETVSELYENLPLEDQVMGNPNAPVTLLEYASMTCPHCKSFHEEIMPAITRKYINSGEVRYIVRPFPFNGDRVGEAAFMLAMCAPGNNYYPMMDALFSTQHSWAFGNDPASELKRISKLSGMSETEYQVCLSNRTLYLKMIEARDLAVRKFNVRATPTIFIDNERFARPRSVANLSAALDEALRRSGEG